MSSKKRPQDPQGSPFGPKDRGGEPELPPDEHERAQGGAKSSEGSWEESQEPNEELGVGELKIWRRESAFGTAKEVAQTPTRRSKKASAQRARSSRNSKTASRSRNSSNAKRSASSSSRRKKSAPVESPVRGGLTLSRIYLRAGAVVALLIAVNVFYFRRHSDLFASLVPRSASISSSKGLKFGQIPQQPCRNKPASMIASMSSLIPVEGRIGGKITIERSLGRLGLSESSIEEIQDSLSEVIDPSLLEGASYPLRARLDPKLKVHGLEIELASGHLLQLCREKDKLKARNLQLRPSSKTGLLSLQLDASASLVKALQNVGEKRELAHLLGDLLRAELDPLTDLRPSDRIDFIVEKRFVGKTFHRYGRVLAFAFRGAAGKFRYFYRTTSSGELAYYDAAGRPMRRRYLKTPTPWYWATSGGGRARPAEQVLRDRRRGAEYRRPAGLPVYAITDLTITRVGEDSKSGAFVESVDSEGRLLRWSGLASPLPDYARGDRLAQGDTVGYVGAALGSRAPRLRLELRDKDGSWVYLPDFLSRGGESGAMHRIGELLGPRALSAHRTAIMPWLKSLAQASRRASS